MIALLLAATAAQAPALAPLTPAGPDLVPLVPPPAEYTLSLKQDEFRVHVTLRPGEPQPARVVEMIFDIGRQQGAEAGEPQPWNDGKLGLSISGPGQRVRYLVRPLGDAGVYGVHWTPSARGLWTLTLAPYQDKDAGPNVTFQVGAGEPMPASAQGHVVQASRVVVTAGRAGTTGSASLQQIMQELGRRWRDQAEVAKPDPAELKAMARLVRAVPGHVPREFAGDTAEFDKLAARIAVALDGGALPPAQQCLECHLKFRDGWVADVSRWPEVRR